MADGHHIRNIVFDDNSVTYVRFSQNVAWRAIVMTAECHKFQCSKIQNGGHPTAIYYDRLLSEMKYDFVESSYAVADLDYNETYITKTQNFKIRYSERRPQWKKYISRLYPTMDCPICAAFCRKRNIWPKSEMLRSHRVEYSSCICLLVPRDVAAFGREALVTGSELIVQDRQTDSWHTTWFVIIRHATWFQTHPLRLPRPFVLIS